MLTRLTALLASSAIVASASASASGCAARREPIYLAPSFEARNVRVIAVAPLVEERAFPETQVPIATYVVQTAERVLESKGYEPRAVAAPPVVRLEQPLLEAESADLPELPERYDLWIAVEVVDTDNTEIGLDTRVRLAGVLVDSKTDEVLWRDRAERESSISGSGFATMSPSVRTYEAVYQTVSTLLATLPDRSDYI